MLLNKCHTLTLIIILGFLLKRCFQLDINEGEEGRVINGKLASIKEHPYTVDYSGCAGAIFGERWILSAAHCYDPTLKRKVRVGSDKRGRGATVDVIRGYPHPQFEAHDYWGIYDILILELKLPLIYNNSVQPIWLADGSVNYVNKSGTIAAFGRTGTLAGKSKVLLVANLTIASDEECYKEMKHFDSTMMVCGKPSGTDVSNLCKGDSGASIVINGTAVGVVSWGDDECPLIGYTSFAKIPSVRSWIKNVTGI